MSCDTTWQHWICLKRYWKICFYSHGISLDWRTYNLKANKKVDLYSNDIDPVNPFFPNIDYVNNIPIKRRQYCKILEPRFSCWWWSWINFSSSIYENAFPVNHTSCIVVGNVNWWNSFMKNRLFFELLSWHFECSAGYQSSEKMESYRVLFR